MISSGASQTIKYRGKGEGKYSTPSLNTGIAGQYQSQASRLFELQRLGDLDRKEQR